MTLHACNFCGRGLHYVPAQYAYVTSRGWRVHVSVTPPIGQKDLCRKCTLVAVQDAIDVEAGRKHCPPLASDDDG